MAKIFLSFILITFAASASVLSGHVLGPDQQPAAGADVWLWQEQGIQHTQTTDVGGFSFAGVKVGTLQVVARKEGLAFGGFSRFSVGDGEEIIQLEEPGEIHLKVATPTDRAPVAGARVFAIMVNDAFVLPVEELANEGFPQWRSADDGTITIPNLPANGFAKINLKHIDYADTYVDFVPVRDRVTPVVLEAGIKVRGRITAADKPLANARVTVFQLGTRGQREYGRTFTDRDGLYSVRLAQGDYFLAAIHPDFASPQPASFQVKPDKDKPGKDQELPDLALLAPYRLHGRVVFPDGAPCPGARVTYREGNTIYDDTFTDSDGNYAIKAGVPKGTLRIGPPTGYKTEILADIKVTLGDQHDAKIEPVKLQKLPAIEGTVTMEDGSPAANVLIASLNLPLALWVITDAEGHFKFQLNADPDAEEVKLLAEHAERFQRAIFSYALKDPKPVAVKLASYSPDEVQPELPGGTNNLSEQLDSKAPEFECSKWFNVESLKRDDLKGKVAVLLFWAGFDTTTEGINKVEQTRALSALYKDIPEVSFVALHDCTSEPREVEDFVKRSGLTCPVGLDKEPTVTFGNYHITFIPEVVLLDKSGNIRFYQPGPRIVEFIKVLRRRAS